jgi:hypothetical protein
MAVCSNLLWQASCLFAPSYSKKPRCAVKFGFQRKRITTMGILLGLCFEMIAVFSATIVVSALEPTISGTLYIKTLTMHYCSVTFLFLPKTYFS